MLAREHYPFLSRKGRAALLVLDALGAIGTALHGLPAYGPPRLSFPASAEPIRSITVFGSPVIGNAVP